MNALSLAPKAENKDVKLSGKKIVDSKFDEGKDFFENIISSIVLEDGDSKNSSFLLSKILNLPSEYEKKEKVISSFSDAPLFTDNQIGQVSIQELLKIATMAKNGDDLSSFTSDSKTLELSLLKTDVKEQFKSAKNIKDLLDIAKKNGIEVKNFQFLNEDAALDTDDKKLVQKINSEDIFKIIDRQIGSKKIYSLKTSLDSKNSNEQINSSQKTTTILETVLASKELNKSEQKKVEKENKNSHILKDIKVQNIENKDDKSSTKVEQKRDFSTKSENILSESNIELPKNRRVKKIKQQDLDKSSNIDVVDKTQKRVDLKENIKINNAQQNISNKTDKKTINSINITNISSKNEQNGEIKQVLKADKLESNTDTKELSSENRENSQKHVFSTESNRHLDDKVKNNPDIKRTFNNFAQEFKEKVESYKPPLMKIKMELKPVGLGDVDVTLLNRGNSLQVNINSNSSTIAIFAQNQTEFKNSLVNMGFSDLQMNFGDSEKKGQNSQQQKSNKNIFEQIDDIEEQDGFEMVIPRYI